MKKLDVSHVRKQFPSLNGKWTFFDNAGGSQIAKQVTDRLLEYLFTSNVQLGGSYETSVMADNRIFEAQKKMAEYINAASPDEIILGPSTTMLLQNLSRAMERTLSPGDEIIVTNCDHEANIGPWINLEKRGVIVKIWEINKSTLKFELDNLAKLMTSKTKQVSFPYVSNILGTVNPVKEIVNFVHAYGAKVCVDAVAFAPHRMIDVADLDVDYLAFSFYKVYGPHYALLFGKKKHLQELDGINHFFIGNNEIPYKLQPGNVNFELSYSLLGITDYLEDIFGHHFNKVAGFSDRMEEVFSLITDHEEKLAKLFLDFLKTKKNVTIIGEQSPSKEARVPTISFIVDGMRSNAVTEQVDPHNIAIRYGDFYARRLIEELGLLKQEGVIRVSMVHYNTVEEVHNLIDVLDRII